ncbi:MAG: hypothetical protein EZS28_027880 [Streblomastix strix]|uniref:Uncharacterized protein n=1 Tax=Streblomastix strix TaxID=222440 RepID=A0A5J4V212_9EUKA|nr:MAG: hypothetical protein EZS28_027880 [Streblomastix strix]
MTYAFYITIEYCNFRVFESRDYLCKDFFYLDRGGNLTMRYSSVWNILERNRPILYIEVSERSNVVIYQIEIESCRVYESSSGVMHISYYTGGTTSVDGCQFNYNVAVTPQFTGRKPFGGALLIQLQESPLSASFGSQSGSSPLNNSRMFFHSNIGDCGGAITVSGTRSLLSEERIQFIHCQFEHNIAGTMFEHPDEPLGNDIYFYFIEASPILYNETQSTSSNQSVIRSSFFSQCQSYNYSPLINYFLNIEGTEKLDQYKK